MFEHSLLKNLRVNESVVRLIHPSLLHYWRSIGAIFLVVMVLAIFFHPLIRWAHGPWVAGVFIIFALLILGRMLTLRALTAGVVTTKRLIDIDRRGLFDVHVAECVLEDIEDVRYRKKGFLHIIANVGTVTVESSSMRGAIALVNIGHPEQVKDLLQRLHRNTTRNAASRKYPDVDIIDAL